MPRRPGSLLAVVCLAAAACSTAPAAATDDIADAVDATVAAGTAQVEIVTTLRTPRDEKQRFRGSGEIDFGNRRAHWVVEPGALPGLGDTDLGFEGSVEALSDDLVLYIRAPLPGGADWLRVDLRARAFTDGDGLGGPLHGNDPSAQLHLLRGLEDGAEEMGRESLHGAPTTRLSGNANLDEAVAATPRGHRDAVERLVAQLQVVTLPVQVWVDDVGRVRRLAYEVTVDQATEREHAIGADMTTTVRTTLEYGAFGTDMAITPPTDEEVVNVDGPFSGFDGFEADRGSGSAET